MTITIPNITSPTTWQKLASQCEQGWSSLKQDALNLPTAAVRWTHSKLKTVLRSFGKITIILGMILGTIYSIPAWKGLQLQKWTSQKDFLEYCNAELASLIGNARQDCDTAVKTGLPPPPGYIARFARAGKRSLDSILRRSPTGTALHALSKAASARSQPFDTFFTFSSQHIVITWLIWCVVFTCLIALARKAWRKTSRYLRSAYNDGHWTFLPLLNATLSVAIFVATFILFGLFENVKRLRYKEEEAIRAYDRYRESLPVC